MSDDPDPAKERIEYVENADAPDDPCTFFFRTAKTTERPAVLLQDIADALAIPPAFLVTWLFPVSVSVWLEEFAGVVGELFVPMEKQSRVRSAYEHVLGNMGHDRWKKLRRDLIGQTVGSRFAVAREFSPKRHNATFEVKGTAKLREELGDGNGAILWVNRFSCYPVLSKRALFQDGVSALAISHKCHGNSESRFAELLINKIQIAAENRYIKERLVFDDGEEIRVQKRALTQLKKGHPVFFTNTSFKGHRLAELSLGHAGRLRMSTGPISIALRTGAPLFSVSTFEVHPFTQYRVEIERLDVPRPDAPGTSKDRSDYVSMARVARASRDIMLEGIRKYPEQSPLILLED